MSDLSISVAMTTFNGSRYLAEQLTSLAGQTVKPLELVVCDDGSTDESISILQSFSSRAPFAVKICKNANRLGYSQNFMKAASLCKGSVIAFCDQDDVWNENKVEVLMKHFAEKDDLLASHDYSVFFEDDHPPIPSYFKNLALSGLSPAVSISGCSLAIRRELMELVPWPPPQSNWSHDMWVCFAALLLEKRGYIRQSLLRYRIHQNNTSGCLVGGDSRLRRFLRRLNLPPFTTSNDLDAFIAHFVKPSDGFMYREAIQQCEAVMTPGQRERALSGLSKRGAIFDFMVSEAYLNPVQRVLGAIALFMRQTYRDGDGMLGLFKDIRGTGKR